MARLVGDAECHSNHGGDSAPGPQLAPEAIGFGAWLQQGRQLGELCGAQSPRSARRWTVSERLQAPGAGVLHPLADSSLADAQGIGALAL
jgi:hypothetical protein